MLHLHFSANIGIPASSVYVPIMGILGDTDPQSLFWTVGIIVFPVDVAKEKIADVFLQLQTNLTVLRRDFRARGAVERQLSVSQVSGSVSLVFE